MPYIIMVLTFYMFTSMSCGTLTVQTSEKQGPSGNSQVSSKGKQGFTGKSGHSAKGTASLERSGDGWRVVLYDDFDFDGAPAPIVALGRDGYRKETKLGELKANKGRQAYEIPDAFKIEEFNEVWLWCTMYDVPLGVAKLSK